MGNRLYVGNLSFNTSSESIHSMFAAVGDVHEVAMPTDRETGQPRGFAFVTMASTQDANNAISQLNGTMLDGRPLRVNEAQERTGGDARNGGGFGGGGGGGGGGPRPAGPQISPERILLPFKAALDALTASLASSEATIKSIHGAVGSATPLPADRCKKILEAVRNGLGPLPPAIAACKDQAERTQSELSKTASAPGAPIVLAAAKSALSELIAAEDELRRMQKKVDDLHARLPA